MVGPMAWLTRARPDGTVIYGLGQLWFSTSGVSGSVPIFGSSVCSLSSTWCLCCSLTHFSLWEMCFLLLFMILNLGFSHATTKK